jgi:alanine dehydrogenase
MRILNRDEVRAALPMAEAAKAMRWAYTAWSTGRVTAPPRLHLHLPEGEAVSLFMPAYVAAEPGGAFPAALTVKAVSVFPDNPRRGLASIQGAVLVLDPDTGRCLALLDGAALTAIRTGAGSAVATDALARPEAATVAVLGAGGQAAAQILGVCTVRAITTVRIYNRTRSRAEALAASLAGQEAIPKDVLVAATAREAVQEADIVCTATSAPVPLFDDSDLKPGVHINAIGAFRPDMQEIPAETVRRARLFVDNRAAVLAEAGDVVQPLQAGLIDAAHILGEIGEVLCGRISGRQNPHEVTLFKSVGMAAQDAVAATVALSRAQAQGLGQLVRWMDGD